MSLIEIVLIIIGIIVIVVSCIIVDHSQKYQNQIIGKSIASMEEKLTEEDKSQLMAKMKELLGEVREETILKTEDTLNKISNEKIMAVNEFSDQIIEKIKRNHEEVVFLYNMLNDKEKDLKLTVKEIDFAQKKLQDILESKAEANKQHSSKNVKPQATTKPYPQTQARQVEKAVSAATTQTASAAEVTTVSGSNSNNNSQILALYSQGRSIVEISKILGLGQGEVKLVIDLFKGKK